MAQVTSEGVEILRVLCGSRAYGLNLPDSDYDYHSVYLVPTRRMLSLFGEVKDTHKIEGDNDSHAWELGHFLRMALKGNPTVLETFVGPVVPIERKHTGADWDNVYMGQMLRSLFPMVLSKNAVYDSFRGYARSQRHKMNIEDNPRRNLKAALAYLRTLYHGANLLWKGTYALDITDKAAKKLLMEFKQATVFTPSLREAFSATDKLFTAALDDAYQKSPLPEEPNKAEVDAFLLKVRYNAWAF